MSENNSTGLKLLREPFPENQIGKLAKGSKAQTQCDAKEKQTCSICGGWHHPKMIHLDYVGHAALTDRLLDADPSWMWEPMALGQDGLPAFDLSGGLWIRLTVCGISRIGYGNAEASQYKEVGAREKEVIGDALRNAAMRFGAALDLWHKGDLHAHHEDDLKISEDQWIKLNELIVATESDMSKFCAHLKIEKLADLPASSYTEAERLLAAKLRSRDKNNTPSTGAAQ